MLYVFGCFFVVPSIVGMFVGLIQHRRLQKEPSYRSKPPALALRACCAACAQAAHELVGTCYDFMVLLMLVLPSKTVAVIYHKWRLHLGHAYCAIRYLIRMLGLH